MERKQIIKSFIGLILILILGVGGCIRNGTLKDPVLWGQTMGTSYSVTTGKIRKKDFDALSLLIDVELEDLNRQMSTWDPESEISRFNAQTNTAPFGCSAAFASVVRRALTLSRSTDGAFDPTLQPLLNLWGFGSGAEDEQLPSAEAIRQTRKTTGWQHLEIDHSSRLKKHIPELQLALGAIAKGYGVDALGKLLTEAGYENWFVEIGGEVVVKGINPDGVPWRIGIQHPTTNPMDTQLQGIIHLSENAVATSGDYRNYIEKDGIIYSHILDPRSGQAVLSETAGVTVVAPSCMEADGVATALFVMGQDAGLDWIEQQENMECMFLIRSPEGEISEKFSSGFQAATQYTSSH